MGAECACIGTNKDDLKYHSKTKRSKTQTTILEQYGIFQRKPKQISFIHAPLYKNPNLFNKFNAPINKPEQVSISCMISQTKINLNKGQIHAKVINQSPVQLWIICGGIEKVSITGLTIGIEKYTWCECLKIKEKSKPEGQWHAAKPKNDFKNSKYITMVLCQISNQNSLFIFHQYTNDGVKNRQKIEWNSLSFDLKDIYRNSIRNSVYDEIEALESQNCISCLSQKATSIFLPCRHMCLCTKCAEVHKKVNKICPLCKNKYKGVILYKQNPKKIIEEDMKQIYQ